MVIADLVAATWARLAVRSAPMNAPSAAADSNTRPDEMAHCAPGIAESLGPELAWVSP
jgi:hypothetical protein